MAAASDPAAENTTWSMDVQLTSEAIGANSTAAKAAASGTRRRRLQGGNTTSRRTGTSKSDEASEGGQGAGIEQPEEEDKQRKQTRQQKRQQEEEGAPVSATAVVPEDVNSIDRESGEGASKRVKGEARLRPRRATPARAAAAAAAAAEAPPPAPPPEPEEDVASPAVHEQPLAVASGEAGRGKVGDKVEDGATATAGAAATSKKPAPTRGRGFGKKAPAPEPKSGGGGASETVEFTRIIKMLKLKPDEYAMARRVVEEVFGPEEAKPWLQELEAAALSQGVSIPETESKARIQRPALEASSGAKERSAPAQEKDEEEEEEEREEEVVAAAPASPVLDVVIAKEKTAEPLKAREEIRDGEEVTLPMEKLGLRRRMPYKASAAPPPPAKAEEREGGAGLKAPRAGRGEGKGAGRRRGGAGRDEEEPELDDEKLLEAGGAAGEDEEEVDEEEDVEALKENVDEAVFRDKRVVATHIKDAKLSEYIKDKKNSRTTRDKFLADVGMVRAEVHPPQRFVEVYYNNWADDFYTAITTSSNRFGPRWWFREALSHGPTEVLAWLRHWYRMAKKHGVLHDSVGRMLSDALKDTLEGEAGIGARSEMQRYGALKDRMRKWREPRIIAIGDVHGCIDEVRALIKKVEYSPGDLVIFLGDLVAKGPDSVEVVRLAREIGALSVRGNHENEVIKWSRAMALGAQSNFKSEHYLIALGLSEEDIEWLRSLPWYISCSDLQLLFVHAGFVSNLRLSKQHPRFMINMRSILGDGTVSARYYQDFPWARTWTGPQTVLFGHDARRGMQEYDQALGLDTGCVYGGNLTACIMPGRQYVQVKAAEAYIVHRYERIMRRAETLKESIMRDSLD